jgi:predicted RNase H-like nuclease (RuvC/YqgF family)
MWRIITLTVVLMFAASWVNSEYYRYTDENGTVRFTDDLTRIPEDQREAVETFASEPGPGDKTEAAGVSTDSGFSQETDKNDYVEEYSAPAGDTFESRAAELNQIQAELDKTRRALEQERLKLQSQAPGEDASSKEKLAYRAKVDALNAKIKEYSKDLKAFEEKVEAFNNRGRLSGNE